MANCNTNLTNAGGSSCPPAIEEVKRIGFTSVKKEDGTKNSMTKTNAALLATWTALFNKYNFRTDVLEKVVVTPIIFDVKAEQGDGSVFERAGFSKNMADGSYQIKGVILDVSPEIVDAFKDMENANVGVYLLDGEDQVSGKNNGSSIEPLELESNWFQNFMIPSRENPGMSEFTLKLKNPRDINKIATVKIADGEVADDSDFYSMINGEMTTGSPATTGGTIIPVTSDQAADPITGIVFGEFNFHPTDNSGDQTLAGAGSLSYVSATNTYTVNEIALLTSGKTYEIQISHAGFDIAIGTLIVP